MFNSISRIHIGIFCLFVVGFGGFFFQASASHLNIVQRRE